MKRTDRALIVRGGLDPAVVGDFLGIGVSSPALDRLAASRERMAREQADRAMRLRRPVKDELTANVADSHVERVVVVEGRSLRFGYGIDRQVFKGHLPVAALRACEQFRRDWEAANKGGAIAVMDPMRVRVDTSVRNYESPGGRVDVLKPFLAACAAIGDPRAVEVFVAVHCIAEGKTIKTACGVVASKGGDGDPRKVTAMLVEAARRLIAHYDPKPRARGA
jgi:hypothetical protein